MWRLERLTVPVVPFVLTSYWSSYYAGRPWYHRRAYWSGYWQSHERFATRLTSTSGLFLTLISDLSIIGMPCAARRSLQSALGPLKAPHVRGHRAN
jgi:hypothetical protein